MSSDKSGKGVMAAIGGNREANNITSSERRRLSASSAASGKFAGLVSQKRNSVDATSNARRASFAEQARAPGFLGGLWHSFTKGSGPTWGGAK